MSTVAYCLEDFFVVLTDGQYNDSNFWELRFYALSSFQPVTHRHFDVHEDELSAIARHAQEFFLLSDSESSQLLALAEEEASNATCYYEFTSLINQSYSPQEKIAIVEMMWRVAYADKELEKYEEALVRKIAELIYVPHGAFIAAKHRVKQELGLN